MTRSGGGLATRLDVAVDEYGPLVICRLAGEFDDREVTAVQRRFRHVDLRAVTTLAIDLTDLTVCDAAGMDWLFELQNRAARSDTNVLVIVGRGPVERLLTLTRLDRYLTIARDTDGVGLR